jgi:hypothetical protein
LRQSDTFRTASWAIKTFGEGPENVRYLEAIRRDKRLHNARAALQPWSAPLLPNRIQRDDSSGLKTPVSDYALIDVVGTAEAFGAVVVVLGNPRAVRTASAAAARAAIFA